LLSLLYLINHYINIYAGDKILSGHLWGIDTKTLFILALLVPILHQIYVLLCWRYELFYKGITKLLGNNGFKIYRIFFFILILSRPIVIICLSISNSMTITINPYVSYILSLGLFLPSFYLFYSVKKYFGFERACGIDHFEPEKFKNKPFVKEGIFKYTSNGMYIYGLLVLWIPGILLQSEAALLAALFNHIYIWVHYYFTELPDIKIIYGKTGKN